MLIVDPGVDREIFYLAVELACSTQQFMLYSLHNRKIKC